MVKWFAGVTALIGSIIATVGIYQLIVDKKGAVGIVFVGTLLIVLAWILSFRKEGVS